MVAMIRMLAEPDLEPLLAHVARLRRQSGRDGDPITSPRSADEDFDMPARADEMRTAWARPLTEPLWTRTWACVVDGVIRGHLDLKGGRLASELHRGLLGIGLERDARGQGHGRTLMITAIAWARASGLAWIDLGVFAHNARARALYDSLGFVEVGVHRDRFRVEGTSIDDVTMVLSLA